MKLKTFYVRAAAAAAAALLFLYPFPAHAADSAALQGQVSAAQRECLDLIDALFRTDTPGSG